MRDEHGALLADNFYWIARDLMKTTVGLNNLVPASIEAHAAA